MVGDLQRMMSNGLVAVMMTERRFNEHCKATQGIDDEEQLSALWNEKVALAGLGLINSDNHGSGGKIRLAINVREIQTISEVIEQQ